MGLGLSHRLVFNKKIWTSSFAVFSTEISLLLFAGLFYLIDLLGWRCGWTLALVFGTNAILAFSLSQVITMEGTRVRVHPGGHATALHTWIYQSFFATAAATRPGSLLYAIAIVLLTAGLIHPLYQRRTFLRL